MAPLHLQARIDTSPGLDTGNEGDPETTARPRDTAAIFALALAARLAVALWAQGRFPPAADGVYYQRIAERIAEGLGYTWLWPDGAVTYAAHYPVGYPAALGALYAVLGPKPMVAMAFNALLGALAAVAAHRLAARAGSRSQALAAGGLVALHPGLVFYTPALMTEGITAALLAIAAALAASARAASGRAPRLLRILGVGLTLGLATLVRPQSLALAPIFGLLAALDRPRAPAPSRPGPLRRALAAAAIVTGVALLVCAPWTARNCARMKRCALVSVNGGWNLLIGADAASTGAWAPVQVPAACREVYDEAEKDQCFGREARRFIAAHPGTFLALAPRKLAATFDYAGAPGFYLHESNPAAFDDRAKTALGAVETLFERVALLAALAVVGRRVRAGEGSAPALRVLRLSRLGVAALGALFVFSVHAWVGYVAFGVAAALRGRALLRGPVLVSAAAVVVLVTAVIHAVFFGAGRYSLVVFPLVTALAPLATRRPPPAEPHGEGLVLL